ncbi:SET domain-containing protein [Panus rudis PR-1116 ss-1]|nr:SET domain-containing protein [Panus rudis PR-1116 ss-1]
MRNNPRWNSLLSWLRAVHGMDTSTEALLVECREAPGAGYGLFAVKAVPENAKLFVIPASAMINARTLSLIYPGQQNNENMLLSPVQLISLHLYLHRPEKGKESLDPIFGPYISTMPRDFDSHPLTWSVKRNGGVSTDLENALLRCLPAATGQALEALASRFWEDWHAVCQYLLQRPEVLRLSKSSKHTAPRDDILDYVWSWLNVNTRCIYYRLDSSPSSLLNMTLCPILDFANHAPTNTQIKPVLPSDSSWSAPGSKKSSHRLGGDYTFVANENVEKDQELFLRYGSHSNRRLFVEYGFVNRWSGDAIRNGEVDGECDVQDLVEKLFEEAGATGIWAKEVLQNEGYWGDWTMHGSPQPAHPSYRLIAALRLLCHAKASNNMETCLQRWCDTVSGIQETISEENERHWRQVLSEICLTIASRVRAGLRRLEESVEGEGRSTEWGEWMVGNIRYLWLEELEVCECVAESVQRGEEF